MLPHMEKRGAGAIVNNASVLGWRAQKEQAHYAAAKAGVMALTRCSAVEAAEHGVRINAVSPSIALHDFLKKASSRELLEQLASREAFGRAAEVWEVANVMIFRPVTTPPTWLAKCCRSARSTPEEAAMTTVFKSTEEMLASTGLALGTTDWVVIDQARIDLFAEATGDHQ